MISFLNAGRMGRLCNMLFSVYGSIGIAVKSNQNYAFPKLINWDAKERFGSTEDIEVWRHFVNQIPEVPDCLQWQEYPYFWGYRDITLPQGNWNLNSHFQSVKYFEHCIDLIRHYATMHEEQTFDAVALHIRRGDYDDSYHPHMKSGYYYNALEHIPRTNIFVFSDNNDEAHKVMKELGRPYTMIDKDYLESWKIMKGCKHFITANSSYSLLPAILANQPDKVVVCPKQWFGDHVELDKTDLYPEGSIVI